MLGAMLTLLGVVTFFLWAVLGHSTPAERQQTLDASCPTVKRYIRYPDGMHEAVCNPTNVAWRK